MYYLRKSPEISFIEIRPVLECMMAAEKTDCRSSLDQYDENRVKETTYADRYLVD